VPCSMRIENANVTMTHTVFENVGVKLWRPGV
jgi:hypothetical protein